MFLKNSNIISKIKRSKVTGYAALTCTCMQWGLAIIVLVVGLDLDVAPVMGSCTAVGGFDVSR